jgi:hypothetical protein
MVAGDESVRSSALRLENAVNVSGGAIIQRLALVWSSQMLLMDGVAIHPGLDVEHRLRPGCVKYERLPAPWTLYIVNNYITLQLVELTVVPRTRVANLCRASCGADIEDLLVLGLESALDARRSSCRAS